MAPPAQLTTYQTSSVALPANCDAARSCFVVAMEPLFDPSPPNLVHHIDIHRPAWRSAEIKLFKE